MDTFFFNFDVKISVSFLLYRVKFGVLHLKWLKKTPSAQWENSMNGKSR